MCGERGGEPNAVKWFQRRGLAEVSCSLLTIRISHGTAVQAAVE